MITLFLTVELDQDLDEKKFNDLTGAQAGLRSDVKKLNNSINQGRISFSFACMHSQDATLVFA